jgi:hypothetical protein
MACNIRPSGLLHYLVLQAVELPHYFKLWSYITMVQCSHADGYQTTASTFTSTLRTEVTDPSLNLVITYQTARCHVQNHNPFFYHCEDCTSHTDLPRCLFMLRLFVGYY